MTAVRNKWMLSTGSFLTGASVLAASLLSEPLLCFLPLLLLALWLLVQYPAALFYVLLFSIPWSVELGVTGTLSTDFPDEPLMVLLAFTVLLLVVQRKSRLQSWWTSPLLWLLIFSYGWTAVTVALSSHLLLSVKYLLAKGWYLLAFVGAPLVLVRQPEKLVRNAVLVLFSAVFTVTLIALLKHAALGFTFATINEALSPFFRNHVNYSALLVCMVPVQLAFYRLSQSRAWRLLILLSLLVVLAALGLSYARGAWLALLAGLVAYALLKRGWLLRGYLLSLLVVAGLVVWLQHRDQYLRFAPHHDTTIFHPNFREHLSATMAGKDVSTAERFYRWVAGARMSRENWATGFGPTTFYQHYKSYAMPVFRTWVSSNREQSTVHNYFLLLLLEQGVPGLAFFLLLLGALFWQAQIIYRRTADLFWKVAVATLASILWMLCTVNFLSDLLEADKVGSIFYLCVAFLMLADRKTRLPPPASEE